MRSSVRLVSSLLALFVVGVFGCDRSPPPPRRDASLLDVRASGGDADGDSISDEDEGLAGSVDTDGDGLLDARELDSDGDGIADGVEAGDAELGTPPRDSDSDGLADFRDLDSDDNLVPDARETSGDFDGDGSLDAADLDDDDDLVLDARELAGAAPSDWDRDGAPDHHDRDADDDSILDGHEHGVDTDRDGVADWHDEDSDGDSVSDADEAGDLDVTTRPVDTDVDGAADFRDADSDSDGLSDRIEAGGRTSRARADTDGDGVDDLVESSYGSDPTSASDSPRTRGDFVFVAPYAAPGAAAIPPSPARDTLSFSTSLRRVDVYFAIDTSGSMEGEIANLTAGFRGTIVPEIMRRIPEAEFGVGRFEDCPSSLCPSAMRGIVDITPDAVAVESALRSITDACGGREPYRQMLWLIATGDTSELSGRVMPRPRRCVDAGSVGWPCFRSDAVRVIVQVGDESMSESLACTPLRSHEMVVAAMRASHIRYVGISSAESTVLRDEMTSVARDTGSTSATTGLPFVYTIGGDGSGLTTTVVDAIEELAGQLPIRVDAVLRDDPSDAIDAVASFVERVETNTSGATVLGHVCASVTIGDDDADGIGDHFPLVLPGTSVCFDIAARPNRSVAPTATPQLFRATVDVVGDRLTPLDARDVFFVVPPGIPAPGGPD